MAYKTGLALPFDVLKAIRNEIFKTREWPIFAALKTHLEKSMSKCLPRDITYTFVSDDNKRSHLFCNSKTNKCLRID